MMSKYNGLDPYEEIARTLYSNGEKSILCFIRELPETILEHYFEWAFEQHEDEETTLPNSESFYMYSAGNDCRKCDGIYKEDSLMDSIQGRYTCNKCGDIVFAGNRYYE